MVLLQRVSISPIDSIVRNHEEIAKEICLVSITDFDKLLEFYLLGFFLLVSFLLRSQVLCRCSFTNSSIDHVHHIHCSGHVKMLA